MFCIVWPKFWKCRPSQLDSESAYFAYRWRYRPTSRSAAFDLLTSRRLITTTTMVDYMLVFVLQKLWSLLGLVGQNIMPLCHYAEQKSHCTSHFRLLLVVFGFSFYCLYTARKLFAQALYLLLHFWWISSCWVVYNGSIWTQIFFNRCQGRWGEKRLLWYIWTWP